MKRIILVILFVLFTSFLFSCSKGNDSEKDKTAPILSGIKTIYHEVGQPMPNLLAGISAFDETDGNVSESIIVDSRNMNLGMAGEYEITYYAYDLSGNKATQTAIVNVSNPETTNLNVPNYPTRNNVIKADLLSRVDYGDEKALLEVMPPLFKIDYNEEAARDLTWNTHYTIQLAPNNYLRKTHLGLNILGSGVPIYIKLQTKSQVVLVERELSSTRVWRESLIEVPDTQRHLLSELLELVVFAPKPAIGGIEGSLSISGIWFEGDAEPSIKVVYNPNEFETIYEVDLSDLLNPHDSFDDNGIAAGGLVTASYDDLTKQLTIINNGYNDWANLSFTIPDKNDKGKNLLLEDVKYVIIELSVTQGAIVKAKSDWSSPDLFEYNEAKDATMQYWVLPVGPNGYQAFAAVSLAASYLQQGYNSSIVVVNSIKLVTPRN
ncbi:MAG: DUF5011 domain-containing protein [Acholeplasmataceae bacterium]|jgi:hypothetical protein|nr:DUF5011 domain-containing protein [Acholeplasmataceae bacterium]